MHGSSFNDRKFAWSKTLVTYAKDLLKLNDTINILFNKAKHHCMSFLVIKY